MFDKIWKKLNRSTNSNDINYDTLKKMLKKDSNIYLIDVRTKQEYDEGHLPGAINMCLYDIEKEIGKINKNSKIVLYCTSGTRSKTARDKLEKMGYENVYNLEDGIEKN